MTDIIKCSRCKCKYLEKFFKVNPRTNIRLKTCDNCRIKCKQNKEKNKCKHGKRKNLCKECGGASFCLHGGMRNRCKKCKGSRICSHGKAKTMCKECGGSALCSHGIGKQYCKQCDGISLCIHDKPKRFCKECKGSGICTHGRRKYICGECCEYFKCPSEGCDYKGIKTNLKEHVKTCKNGMVGSGGEIKIKSVLESMEIEYKYDATYEVKDKRLLRWDFIITGWNHSDDAPLMFIEYDGQQHFKSIKYFGGDDKLKETQRRDKIKDDFCKDKFKLLRIPYTEFENIGKLIADFMRDNTNWGIE